ncbi:hypothetical protein RI129_006822 [Pyrocoelia pectoralis]|uniref:Synaptic plasticity regulator PANTS n=1 Tax=Pyrocoelia pectoralis TaxID=417401 RepID=A0AAN7VD46_9COLE
MSEEEKVKDEWMIRPCTAYLEDYKDCRSISARFHQYFIYGKTLDCSQWRRDYDNCKKWEDNKDTKAANSVIKSDTERRMQRLRNHYANNVWTKRNSPPKDWNNPLPEYLQKEYENTYLNLKSKEMKGESVDNILLYKESLCSIM